MNVKLEDPEDSSEAVFVEIPQRILVTDKDGKPIRIEDIVQIPGGEEGVVTNILENQEIIVVTESTTSKYSAGSVTLVYSLRAELESLSTVEALQVMFKHIEQHAVLTKRGQSKKREEKQVATLDF